MIKNKINDANVYSWISWLVFCVASVLSAMLNLNLFIALTVESKIFMGFISFTIEGGKLITLTAANTVSGINTKIKSVKLFVITCLLFLFYIGLSSISILAGVGFSQSEIYKSTAESSVAITYIEQDIATVTAAQKKYEDSITESDSLANTSDMSIGELQTKKAEADRLYNQYEAERQTLQSRMDVYYTSNRSDGEWLEGFPGAEYNNWRSQRDATSANRNQARADSQSYQAQINDLQSGRSISRAQEKIDSAKKELDETIESLGTLISLNTQLREAKKLDNDRLGGAIMFTLIMEGIGHKEWASTFRLLMLIISACLIELFIFVFSPAVTVERAMLKRFKKFLPATIKKGKERVDLNIDELIKSFEVDNSKFEYENTLKLSMADKKKMKLMAQELAEERTRKLQEIHEAETEKLKNEVERYSELRLSSEESYKGLLASHANEVEELRKKIQELETKDPTEDNVIPVPVVASIPFKLGTPTPLEFESENTTETTQDVIDADTNTPELPTKKRTRKPKIIQEDLVDSIETNQEDQSQEHENKEEEPEVVIWHVKTGDEEPVKEETEDIKDLVDTNNITPEQEPEIIKKVIVEPGVYNTNKIVLEKVQKPIDVEEPHEEDKKDLLPKKNYRFGMCSDRVKNKFVMYVKALVMENQPGDYCKDTLEAANEASLTEKQHRVFDERLLDMTIKGVPLIAKKSDGYINNFTAEDIITFTTKIV
jgi:hypothetical protein